MNKIFIFSIIVIGLIISVNNTESIGRQNDFAPKSISNDHKTKKTIKLNVDLEEQKKLQAEVDNGHQPWRLEPVDVAFKELFTIDRNIDYKKCRTDIIENSEAVVTCKSARKYYVNLKKMIRSDGIWTAISVTIER
jgi:hypothetical protein